MKTLTITNLMFQFDIDDMPADKTPTALCHEFLASINEVLTRQFPDSSPAIFFQGIGSSVIEATNEEDEI